MAPSNLLGKTTCTAFSRPAFSARPRNSKRVPVCKASEEHIGALVKLVGAAAGAQIALLSLTGAAVATVAQPQYDLALETPNPLKLAQDAKSKLDNAPAAGIPGPAPSLTETKNAVKDVAGGGGGLKEAAQGGGRNISATRATGDISLGGPLSGVGDVAKRVQQAGDALDTGKDAGKAISGETKSAIKDVTRGEAGRSGGTTVGDISFGGKAQDAPSGGNGKSGAEKAGNVELPGPAPSLGDAQAAVKDVASGGGGLKEAARGGGRNISATRATGDISFGDVGELVGKAKEVGDMLDTGRGAGTGSSAASNVDLPGPAPSLEQTQAAAKDVASGGGGLKAAVASGGANISRKGDALPDGLKEGQYKPT